MSVINTSNAIPAKARAKYGQRLKQKDYKILISCRSVAEVIAYLKFHTHYSSILAKVNEYEVHRGQIEMLLRQKLFYDFDSLCRYEMSIGSNFSRYIVRRYEINQLIHFLTLLNSGKTEEYIFTMPGYFNRHTDIHLNELINASDYDTLLKAVRNSPYEEILTEFAPVSGNEIDIPGIEDRLYLFMYDELHKAIESLKSKSEKAEMMELFNFLIDFTNFNRIYRLKTFHRMGWEDIRKHLLPYGTLTPQQVFKLCETQGISEFIETLYRIPSGRIIKKIKYNYAGEISARAKFNISRKNMYFSSSPAVVLISYMLVVETELSNIIDIIEGVRYGLLPDEIDKLLIYSI